MLERSPWLSTSWSCVCWKDHWWCVESSRIVCICQVLGSYGGDATEPKNCWTMFEPDAARRSQDRWQQNCTTKTGRDEGTLHIDGGQELLMVCWDIFIYAAIVPIQNILFCSFSGILLISVPRLGVYYFSCRWLCLSERLSIRLSVCHGQTSDGFFFCFSMESSHFFGHQFSMCHSTKCCS